METALQKTRDRKEAFLAELIAHGSVTRACERSGVARSVAYHWRQTDDEVARMWEQSTVIRMDAIRDEVVEKALVASGRIVEEHALGEDGLPLWDDDLGDFVTLRRLVDYDGQILKSLVNKTLASADGRNAPSVTVNTQVNVAPQRPNVVRQAPRPSWMTDDGPEDVEDADYVVIEEDEDDILA